MHLFVSSILSSDIHLPSSVKEWQIPHMLALPSPPLVFLLEEPEDEHETSYLALSVKIFNLS